MEIFWAIKDKSISAQFADPGAAEFFIQARLNSSAAEGKDGNGSPEKRSRIEKETTKLSKPTVIKRQQYMLSSPAGIGGRGAWIITAFFFKLTLSN